MHLASLLVEDFRGIHTLRLILDDTTVLGESRLVSIHNPHGDLRVRAASDDNVALSAIVQRHRDDTTRPRLVIERVDEHLQVEVRYDESDAETSPSFDKRRVDLTVFVPTVPSVRLRTDAGLLNVRLGGELELATVSGAIDVKTSGRLQASTERGDVVAVLQSARWSGRQQLSSKSGSLEVWLPPEVDTVIEAETAGRLTTDFSVDIRHDDPTGRKQIKARLGAGQSQLALRSAVGAVRLLRSPDAAP